MDPSPLIPILLLLPVFGGLLTLFATPPGNPKAAGPIAFCLSLIPLGLVIYMLGHFPQLDSADAQWHFTFDYNWISNLGVRFSVGMDTIGLWLVVLTAVLTPISILASFKYIKERQPEFYAWMLILHAGMLGVFVARDILLFYLFFEITLIPMFFIIGIWGGQDRRKAAGKFFLFTFAGSVLTLVAIIFLSYVYANGWEGTGIVPQHRFSFQLDDLRVVGAQLPLHVQTLVFFGLMAGFAVKVPLFPVHTWLPLAHTEAPTAGSVILAGVLLKLGTYGLLRFALPILPAATMHYAPSIAVVCIIGIIYGALVSWAQGDMKKLIAYSSVSHLAFCVLGMFALTTEGMTGSVMYMLNHGLSTGALFLVVGMIYERYHTRDMNQVGGIARRVPALAAFAVFFVFSSVALPGLNGFVSEFLVLLGTFVSGNKTGNLGPAYAIPAATGVILGAVYLLYWAGRVIFGPLKEPVHAHGEGHETVKDLSPREWMVLAPMAMLILYLGIYPQRVISSLDRPIQNIVDNVNAPANEAKVGVAEAHAGIQNSECTAESKGRFVELELQYLVPEIILLAAACAAVLMGLSRSDAVRKATQILAALACAGGFVAAALTPPFNNALPLNPNYITLLACLIGMLSVFAAWDMPAKSDPAVPDSNYRGEFFGMMLFSLAGVSMIGKVNDLVWLFIALELVSIPTYIMVATGRSQIIAQEAGIKYFFLGALAAAIFLFGFSYIYGATGSTRFSEIALWFVRHPEMTPLALIGVLMAVVGIGYKIAAVPLHFYTPDVYQGAATPVTAFLAFAPKAAGMVAIILILSLFGFNYSSESGHAILAALTVICVLTMTIGNVLALLQRNIKRIFAYSSIAHSGYMLVGLIAMNGSQAAGSDGISATIFYLTSYALMNLGAFAVLIYLQGKTDGAEELDDLAGVAKSHPAAALMMALCLFSLIGMPLTVGFLGKFYLIQQALLTGHTVLAIVVVVNAAIAAAYYLKIIAAMYLREALYPVTVRKAFPIRVAAVFCSIAVVVFFLAPRTLFEANNTEFGNVSKPAARGQVNQSGASAVGVGAGGRVSAGQ